MGKLVPDAILDAMLDAAEGTHITVCSAEPTNYADIVNVDLTGAAAIGSPTAAAGDVSGRKNIWPAVSGVSITATGAATHVVLHNNTDTIYLITTCPSQALTSGNTVDVGSFDHELQAAA